MSLLPYDVGKLIGSLSIPPPYLPTLVIVESSSK
jgi:hypothetical protein